MKKLIGLLILLFSSAVFSAPIQKSITTKKQHSSHVVSFIKNESKVTEVLSIFNANKQYDDSFKQSSNQYSLDYRLLKVVCTVESKLKYDAVSKEGAIGLCQLMPKTWNNIKKISKKKLNKIKDPHQSIHAAATYFNYLDNFWRNIDNKENRIKLVLASYNAGEGNISRSKKKCRSGDYRAIMGCLKSFTSKKSEETKNYVDLVMSSYYRVI